MPIRTKSIYEPASEDDGIRVLTTNYWPRGISRERAGTYLRVLAPSRELLHAFKEGRIDWEAYRVRYLAEMAEADAQAEIGRLAELAETQIVTVMCVCREERQCHRSLLRELIEEKNR